MTIQSVYQICSGSRSELTRTDGPRQGLTLSRTLQTYQADDPVQVVC